MNQLRSFGLLTVALVLFACTGGGQPTTSPSSVTANPGRTSTPATAPTGEPATLVPTSAQSQAPTASLDPALSDAGIVARVTLSNDSGGGRDGTHDIYGVADDGSECSGSFESPEYIVVAWHDDAPNGQIHRFGITVAADDVPTSDGSTTGIVDGGVSFSFASESGLGTQYTGNATRENEGSVTIDVTRSGDSLTFDFAGVTSNAVNFAGQLICAEV